MGGVSAKEVEDAQKAQADAQKAKAAAEKEAKELRESLARAQRALEEKEADEKRRKQEEEQARAARTPFDEVRPSKERSVSIGGSIKTTMMNPGMHEMITRAFDVVVGKKQSGDFESYLQVFTADKFPAIKGTVRAIDKNAPKVVKDEVAFRTFVDMMDDAEVSDGLNSSVAEQLKSNGTGGRWLEQQNGHSPGTIWIFTKYQRNGEQYVGGIYYLVAKQQMDLIHVLAAMVKDGVFVRDGNELCLPPPN